MKGIAMDFHPWRGLFAWPQERDLFHLRLTLGFCTVWVCKFCISDRFSALARLKTGAERR